MFDYALRNDRLIGMLQPFKKCSDNNDISENSIYQIGCAGKIIAFNQTNDNRYEIVLKGVCRFKIKKELNLIKGFRLAKVDWGMFLEDMDISKKTLLKQRIMFEEKLRIYFKKININADWQAIEASSDEDLLNSISMTCPFTNSEKQALLEAVSLTDRLKVLISLFEMSINDNKSYQSKSIS